MDPSKLPAKDLLRLCLESGDQVAWLEFVRRFQPLISKVVFKCVRRRANPDPGLIDDLVQDTYLKLCANNFRALRDFDCQHENALFGFLKVVASNAVEDYFRKMNSDKRGSGRETEDLESVPAAAVSASFPESAERNILIREIRQCLDGQASDPNFARDSTIFWLYYQQGLTAKAISQLPSIGLTVKGVESTLLRLTRLVREKMNSRTDQPDRSERSGASGRAAASGG